MKIIPKSYHVLIQPDAVEKKSKGGIILPDDKLAGTATVTGTVLAIGPDCWPEHKFEEAAAKVGDRVMYQRGSGMRVPDDNGGFLEDRLVLNDLDIVAVLEKD